LIKFLIQNKLALVQNSKRIVTQKAMARAATAAPTVAMERAPATTAAAVTAGAVMASAEHAETTVVKFVAAQLTGKT